MKCTSCKSGLLHPCFIDSAFRAHTCNNCGGNWILVEDYICWKEQHPEHNFAAVQAEEIEDNKNALICPLSGTLMRKFRIAITSPHRLDYSSAVGGIWLDKGEWELLKQEGLAGSLNAILTDQWQKKIKQDNATATFAELYQSKFSKQDYEKLKDVRHWLSEHPQKADMQAYLFAQDPYSAMK